MGIVTGRLLKRSNLLAASRCALFFFVCLFPLAWPPINSIAAAPAIETQWGGYLRAVGTRSWQDRQSIYQLVEGGGPLDDFQGETRLKSETFAGEAWSLEIHYELVALQGDTVSQNSALRQLLTPAAAELLVGSDTIDDQRRLMSLTRVIDENDDRVVYHRLDRLNITHAAGWGTIRLGRQALTWGNGMIFNPMDLFNPFAPTSVLRDYKVGDDMLHLQLPLDQDELQLLHVPRRDPATGEVDDAEASWATKWHTTAAGLDLDLMAARHFEDHLLGIGANGYLSAATWRADALYTRLHSDDTRADFLQIVVNSDFAWQLGGKNVYGLLEYYYNGLGQPDDYEKALTDPVLVVRLERGELFTLGHNYLGCLMQYEAHPLIQPSTTLIVNLDDPSALIQLQLTWDAATNLQLIAGGRFHWAGDNTEYGGFNTTLSDTNIRVAATESAFLWLTWYF